MRHTHTLLTLLAALLLMPPLAANAEKISDIRNTKHNLSFTDYSTGVTEDRTVQASSETQICVFCHTPHKAQNIPNSPLWNRALSSATYTPYTSESLDAGTLAQPDGSSKLCLSCHDGTMAIGSVGVINGQENSNLGTTVNIAMTGTVDDKIPDTSAATPGATTNLDTNLTNDHPISFQYLYEPVGTNSLAQLDGELVEPLDSTDHYIANRSPGATRPDIPLENGNLQCISCHDPHIRETEPAKGNAKFLRLNRFQQALPGTGFSASQDIVCLGCHQKAGWSSSAHAEATNSYSDSSDAVVNGDFPSGIEVWQAACLNCHDTHTVQGARRLLRGGVDGSGNPAMEQTCYQCHDGTTTVLTSVTTVPNVKDDFASSYRMPISTTTEVHAIGTGSDATEGTQRGKDFVESPTLLGKDNLGNRHAECTDCHNPHRVKKNRLYNGSSTDTTAGTHTHNLDNGETHSNIASGVLAGSSGVEPLYSTAVSGPTSWGAVPESGYALKRGYSEAAPDPVSGNTDSWLTREYQICLKCHSDYAFTTPPTVGGTGLTPYGTNGVNSYTNQAMEFRAATADQGEPGGNHRSWHPVIANTGRSAAVRGGMTDTNFLDPWNDTTATNVGNQTMYCSDCHGSDTGMGSQTVVPPNNTTDENGDPWGPHGSSNIFILKGPWDPVTSPLNATNTNSEICFKCHDKNAYSPAVLPNPYPVSGFACTSAASTGCTGAGGGGGGGGGGNGCNMSANAQSNLHIGHVELLGELRCSWCHTAVPHGWQNKALLVDITNDPTTTCAGGEPCTDGPYYQNAMLGGNGAGTNTNGGAGVVWKASGDWVATDCGGGAGGWMSNNVSGCNAPP